MSPLFALALAVAPAPYDDGAQGCLAYGVFTEVVANGGNLTFTVPASPDGFEVTAVVLGDESDPVQHEIIAPVSPGQVVDAGYYIDHVHICYAQTELPEESWPDTTSTPSTTAPSSTSPATTSMPPASTSSPTPNSSSTSGTPSTTSSENATNSPTADPTLPVTGGRDDILGGIALAAVACGLLGWLLVGVARRRT